MSTTTSSTTSVPTGTTGAGGGNMLRITGLNTGLDVDAMVKKMLTADQTKIDQAKQNQQWVQWKQEAYQSIIKDVQGLQSAYFDIANSSNYLLTSNNYDNMTATSTDSSTITAKAGTGAAAGTYKMEVTQLAKAAQVSGNSSINSEYKISTADASSWGGTTDGKTHRTIDFTIGTGSSPVTTSVDLSGFTGTTTADLAAYINNQISNNSSLSGKVTASAITTTSDGSYIKFTPASGSAVSMSSSTIGDIGATAKTLVSASSSTELDTLNPSLKTKLNLNLTYNGTTTAVSLDNSQGTATIDDLVTAIKTATGGAVTGKFDDMTGKFSLETAATGSSSTLSINTGSSNSDLLSALGMSAAASTSGQDAIVKITEPGGTATTLTETSNNFTVNGVSYSVTGTTTADSPVSISVTQDTSKMHDLISNFLDKYNSLVSEIQTKLTEKRDYDYKPLTDSQKSSMSDTDITNWNNKAKQGVLENDDNLENLLDQLQSAFTTPVVDSNGNKVSTLSFGNIGSNSIGLDTSNLYSENGKVTITDDTKFTEALKNNPDEIMKLFTTTSDSTDTTAKFNQSGIFERISDILQNNVGPVGTTLNTGTLTKYSNLQDDYSLSGGSGTGTIPDQIYQKQLLINDLTSKMSDDQTKYYDQFTQLETAMEQLNSQSSAISSYFS